MSIVKPLLIFILSTFMFASKLSLLTPTVNNAQTALLLLDDTQAKNPKLTLMTKNKLNINFEHNPFKKGSFYALVPISYYLPLKTHKIIVSYTKNGKKTFEALQLTVKDGNYKSEIIQVKPSKVKPNKTQQKRTRKEYKEAIAIYKSKSSQLQWEEAFMYPMQSKITSAFGTKRVYNNLLKSYHSGTDFKAPTGTPIYAANDGMVKMASHRYYAGNAVIIDHGQGVYTCYFHLSKLDVKIGQKVKKGQHLGLSGATGRVTGPHLHFSARVHGIQVDPLQLLEVLNLLQQAS
jgi:murein DD-endopeptidase MepM/ murein hydrolase activator NlpD